MYPFSFDGTKFPKILESIKVVDNLHVKLQYNGKPLPLPQWFVCSRSQRNNEKGSYLKNFPACKQNTATHFYNELLLLNELNQRNFYKRQRRPPYLSSMIRYALHLCYMSLQTYRLLFEGSPMVFLSLLNNIQQGGVDALKALKTLYERSSFS